MTRPSPSPRDERALIEQAREDPEAFAELYRLHVDAIYRFVLRRTGNRSDAEDITAVTFERALASFDRFRVGPNGMAPWLFRIAGNEVLDRHRQARRRRGDRAQRGADRSGDRVSFDDLDRIDDGLEAQRVRNALDSLNPRYQRVLTLRYLGGLEPVEAAAAMGIPRRLFAVLLHRARTALQKSLEESLGEVDE